MYVIFLKCWSTIVSKQKKILVFMEKKKERHGDPSSDGTRVFYST